MEEGDEVLIDFDENDFEEGEDFFSVDGEGEDEDDDDEDDDDAHDRARLAHELHCNRSGR